MADYSLISASSIKQVLALNETCKTCRAEMAIAEQAGDDMVSAMVAGSAMIKLRQQLEPLIKDLMPLVGSPVGITTDFGATPSTAQVVDVMLPGLLAGARPIGGEMHITKQGKLYLTKAYWERMFKSLPGISDVQPPALGLPRSQKLGDKEYAIVNARLTYRLNGKLCTLDRSGDNAIAVIWNQGMQLDAVHGKTKKRLYQAAYGLVTGRHVGDEEDGDGVVTGQVVGSVVETTIQDAEFTVENPGDEIARDAGPQLADQTPAGPPPQASDEMKRMALATMRLKTGQKAVAAWVQHCATLDPPVDIAAEADQYLKELAAQKTKAA